jgi:co-chaperonin GroES (HSP10)
MENKFPYTPVGKKILVRLPQKKKQTDGGIILPEQSINLPNSGIVIAAGREVGFGDDYVNREILWSPYATVIGPIQSVAGEFYVIDECDLLVVGKQNPNVNLGATNVD